MGISSLGVGSGILTQDVLDQLRQADEIGRIKPIETKLSQEDTRLKAFNIMEAHITNLSDSIAAVGSNLLFDERSVDVIGDSVEITADPRTDIQDFTLKVEELATKQIEQSGSFTSKTSLIADDNGTIYFKVGSTDDAIAIDYTDTMTLEDLKNRINDEAGDVLNATIVQVGDSDFRLFLSSVETGSDKDITISSHSDDYINKVKNHPGRDKKGKDRDYDNVQTGGLNSKLLTNFNEYEAVQEGQNAKFEFNGETIERGSNIVKDLISGLEITLKETGTSVVSVSQNRSNILEKVDNFVKHYNEGMNELNKLTKASANSTERGAFSADSTIKSMKRAMENMFSNLGGGAAYMTDFGIEVDKDGLLSVDKDTLNDQFDKDAENLQAFFAGGTYTKTDKTTVELEGTFVEMTAIMEQYSKYNGDLDRFKESMTENVSILEERKLTATERLNSKYEIMKKQFAAYDLIINRINSASSMFTQLANAQNSNN